MKDHTLIQSTNSEPVSGESKPDGSLNVDLGISEVVHDDSNVSVTYSETEIQHRPLQREKPMKFLKKFREQVLDPLRYEQLVKLRSRAEQGQIEIFESQIVKRYHPHPAHSKTISRASLEEAMRELALLEEKYCKENLDENIN